MDESNTPEDVALPPALVALGARLRAERKRLKVSAVAAAEAASISRVTLHRIERGEPSVAMGAWFAALSGVGLELRAVDPHVPADALPPDDVLPDSIVLADYPQLQRLAWQLGGVAELSASDALDLYERNWRHLDIHALQPREQALVRALARQSGGRLLVRT